MIREQDDWKFVKTAVEDKEEVWIYIPREMKEHQKVAFAWVRRRYYCFVRIPEKFQRDEGFVLAAVQANPQIYMEIGQDLKGVLEIIKAAIKKNPEYIQIVPERILENTSTLWGLFWFNQEIMGKAAEQYANRIKILVLKSFVRVTRNHQRDGEKSPSPWIAKIPDDFFDSILGYMWKGN